MFVNKIKIAPSALKSGSTHIDINVPIDMNFQIVDNSELIERVFVNTEVEKAINPIIDYDRVRFVPKSGNNDIKNIQIYLNFLSAPNVFNGGSYGDIGFVYDDINLKKNSFTQSFVKLLFYDTPYALTQKLVTYTTLYCRLNKSDIINTGTGLGTPKPVTQIPVLFYLDNPIYDRKGNSEGFYLYDYKSDLNIGDSKYLYMKASFNNAKNVKVTNLMVKNSSQTIEKLVNEQYVRFKLYRTTTGYYYEIDTTYQGNGVAAANNVSYATNTYTIKLYEISAT